MDRAAIDGFGIPGYELMCRAGQACFAAARERWPEARSWLVVCGAGNNAGDGFIVARLARAAGLDARVAALGPTDQLHGDAARAWRDFEAAGGKASGFQNSDLDQADLVIDAVLGTGLDREVTGTFCDAIAAINASGRPIVAVDIPSGLNADSGLPMGTAVCADLTVTFVGRKTGLYLGAGPDHAGEVVFDDLGIPPEALGRPRPAMPSSPCRQPSPGRCPGPAAGWRSKPCCSASRSAPRPRTRASSATCC